MVNLCGSPTKLENDDKRGIVDKLCPVRRILTFYTFVEDKRETAYYTYRTWKKKIQEK
jgi:hypothetical protein